MELKAGVITLNQKADLPRKWRTLAHEILHAASDYEHWVEETVARPLEVEMGRTAAALKGEE